MHVRCIIDLVENLFGDFSVDAFLQSLYEAVLKEWSGIKQAFQKNTPFLVTVLKLIQKITSYSTKLSLYSQILFSNDNGGVFNSFAETNN
jgi:hypothetical protein